MTSTPDLLLDFGIAVLLLCGCFATFVAAVAIHELGHAVVAWLLGYRVVMCAVGFGRPFIGVRLRGGFWTVRGAPHGGLTLVTYPGSVIPRWRDCLMILGGPTANLVAANVAVGLAVHLSGAAVVILLLLAALNAIAMVFAVIPHRFRAGGATYMSDGLQVLRLMVGVRGEWADVISQHRVLRPVFLEIGDRRALARYADAAAIAWSLLGATEQAEAALAEAESHRDPDADRFERGLAAVARGAVARAADRSDAAGHIAAGLGETDDRGLRQLVRLLQGEVGEVAHAWSASDPAVRCLVCRDAAGSDPERAVEHLGSAVGALIQAGQRLGTDDRALLVPATDRLLLAFREAIRRVGRDESTETLALLAPLYRGQGDAVPAQQRVEQRRFRLGLALIGVGVLTVGFAIFVTSLSVRAEDVSTRWVGFAFGVYATLTGVLTLGATGFAGAAVLARRRRPDRLPTYGTRTLTWVVVAIGVGGLCGAATLLATP